MTDGSHFQLAELDVQLVVVVSRNVLNVYDPAGNGPALGEAVEDGEGGGSVLLRQTVSAFNRVKVLFVTHTCCASYAILPQDPQPKPQCRLLRRVRRDIFASILPSERHRRCSSNPRVFLPSDP